MSKGFPRRVEGRISESRYQELVGILEKDSTLTMSELIRRILQNQPVRIQVRERGVWDLMEVLISIDIQLKKIGTNLNQVIQAFHGNSSSLEKFLLGKKLLAFQKELSKGQGILEEVLAKIQDRWLSE
ncbi:hypothetical protein Aconfl_33580 [Algoriphagus confluentis]|uniref:Plasmid mobilization relaxosome protein MobC n=2 Tax=Algoriphagus confluentis TaxID=1697556 RepID=A0ABQ6PTY0_9BACT|nr:hypothetical protein Aconfl_33580 [Algoriphagus confluentis]